MASDHIPKNVIDPNFVLAEKAWADKMYKDMLNSVAQPNTNHVQTATAVQAMQEQQLRELKRLMEGNLAVVNKFDSQMGQDDYMRLLAGRLRIKQGQIMPFQFCQCFVSDKVAVLFLVINERAITLEDEPHMFPSDKLVAEIRLLLG